MKRRTYGRPCHRNTRRGLLDDLRRDPAAHSLLGFLLRLRDRADRRLARETARRHGPGLARRRAGAEDHRGQRAADRLGAAGQQPGQHPCHLPRHGAVHPAARRWRRGDGDADHDLPRADLRRGAAQDLRHHQPRGRGRHRGPADPSGHPDLLARGGGDPRAGAGAAQAHRRTDRPRQPDPRRARGDRRGAAARPLGRRGGKGRPRPHSRRARPGRAHGRGDHAAPLGDREHRRRGRAAGDPAAVPRQQPHPPARLPRRAREHHRHGACQGPSARHV